MAKMNTEAIIKGMPKHTLFNTMGLQPAYVQYVLTKTQVEEYTLEFVRSFVPDVKSVTFTHDKQKLRNNEGGISSLYMVFAADAESICRKFGTETVLVGSDKYRSPELKRFLEQYALKVHSEDGFVGEFKERRPGPVQTERTVGFELDILKVMRNMFDANGVGYANATNENKTRSNITWGELLGKDNNLVGIYVRKHNGQAPALESDRATGTHFPVKEARNFN